MWENFGWNFLDCFLRPQAHLVELACPGTADALLPLLSAYRAHGIDGHFATSGRGHFHFLQHVGSRHLGIKFHVDRHDHPDELLHELERTLAAGQPMIVPGLPRWITPGLDPTGSPAEGHYYLVLRREVEDVVVLDSAEAAPYERTESYREIRLPRRELVALIAAFFDTSRGRAESPLREPGLWTLRAVSLSARAESPRQRVIAAARAALAALSSDNAMPFDRRHLVRLREMDRSWTRAQQQRSLKLYLKEANLCALHLAMLATAVGDAAFVDEVGSYLERNRRRREQLMVESLVRPEAIDWDAVENMFELDRDNIVRRARAALGA